MEENDLKELLWANLEVRKSIEDIGVKVSPCNFYSSIPSITEIEDSFEYFSDIPPYATSAIFNKPEKSREFLEVLSRFSSEYKPLEEGDEGQPSGYFWKNSQFGWSDAMAYYAMIRYIKPRKIIEIGSGFSTLVAIDAIEKNGSGEVICIEPFPREFLLQSNKIELNKTKAQMISADWLNNQLNDGDVLFIDSTHTVKTGSDCLHIYLRLLPNLKRDIYVHVHDVFLPFGLPKSWLLEHQIYWTEQYLLLAFLLDNPKVEFLFGSAYHNWANEDMLNKFMHGQCASGGGSFWFKYSGSLTAT